MRGKEGRGSGEYEAIDSIHTSTVFPFIPVKTSPGLTELDDNMF